MFDPDHLGLDDDGADALRIVLICVACLVAVFLIAATFGGIHG